jgi:hypothetical protein
MSARTRNPANPKGKHSETKSKQSFSEPIAVVTRDGKTRIEHFARGRFVRLGEVRGKTLAWIELYTARLDGHSITLRFQDRTELLLEIAPGFTIKAEYFSDRTGEYRSLRKWPAIRSEA